MLNSPGNQGYSIGLSVGATNLAGTRDGHAAVLRPAELTLRGQRLIAGRRDGLLTLRREPV